MINKIIEELEIEKYPFECDIPSKNYNKAIDKAIEIVKYHEVEFHNYEMYCDLLEENEKLKTKLKKIKDIINASYE